MKRPPKMRPEPGDESSRGEDRFFMEQLPVSDGRFELDGDEAAHMAGSRRMRIANGAGVKVVDVNQLLKQFQQMQKVMKMMKGGGAKKLMRQVEAMRAKGNLPPGM